MGKVGYKCDIYGIYDFDNYIRDVESWRGFYGRNFKYFQTHGGGPEGGYIIICGEMEKGKDYKSTDSIIYEISRGWGKQFTLDKVYNNHNVMIYGETDFTQGSIRIKRNYIQKNTI